MWRSPIVSVLAVLLFAVVATTVIGLVVLWPDSRTIPQPEGLAPPRTAPARIVALRETPCGPNTNASCVRVTAELEGGGRASFTVTSPEAEFGVGDHIRVYKNPAPAQALPGVRIDRYGFSDFERRAPLAWLVGIFAALVIATGR